MFKRIIESLTPNPFDALLKRARTADHKRFLIAWNRGLGDIPLGLYAMQMRIRQYIPDASITFLTRPDLEEGFHFLPDVDILVASHWKRGTHYEIAPTLDTLNLSASAFDVILEKPDPTRWLKWQIGTVVPKLRWKSDWDALADRYALPKNCVGVHVHTETTYGYEKNWSAERWSKLFDELSKEQNTPIVLFGFKPEPLFSQPGVIDLRGKTTLCEMLAIIKNHCRTLVLPDSGVLAYTYYLDHSFPIHIVSLWADPRQGILKQHVLSPNPQLYHRPLIGSGEKISAITPEDVLQQMRELSC